VPGATLLFALGPFTPPFRVPSGSCHGHAWAQKHRSAQKHTWAQKKALSFGGPKLLSILLNFIKLLVDSNARMIALGIHRLNSINFTRESSPFGVVSIFTNAFDRAATSRSQPLSMFCIVSSPFPHSQLLSMFWIHSPGHTPPFAFFTPKSARRHLTRIRPRTAGPGPLDQAAGAPSTIVMQRVG